MNRLLYAGRSYAQCAFRDPTCVLEHRYSPSPDTTGYLILIKKNIRQRGEDECCFHRVVIRLVGH